MAMVFSAVPSGAFAATACSHQADHDMLTASSGYQTYGYLTEEFGMPYMPGIYYAGESEPTCTDPYFGFWKCEECGFFIREMLQGFPALGHEFTDWRTAQEPTCTQSGVQVASCTRCGENTRQAVDALGHDFQSWTVQKEATCTEAGTEEAKCVRCSEAQTRPIPAAGHDFGEWELTKEATDDADGEETRTCSICKEEEHRAVAPFQIRQGDRGLHVLVLQALLQDYGTYTGKLDGVFGQDLTEAVAGWQRSHGMNATGIAYNSTFTSLVDTFAQEHTKDDIHSVLHSWEGGFTARYSMTMDAESNGDGTHKVDYRILGIRFIKEGMGEIFFFSDVVEAQITKEVEACRLGNEAHTCTVCSYRPELSIEDYPSVSPFDGFSLLFLPPAEDLKLMPVTGLRYNQGTWIAFWDAFPDADEYRVEVYRVGETGIDIDTSVHTVYFDMLPFLKEHGTGSYKFCVTAVRNDQEISSTVCLSFAYGKTLTAPKDLTVDNTTARWDCDSVLPTSFGKCFYQLSVYTEDDTLAVSTTTHDKCVDLVSLLHGTIIQKEKRDYYITVQTKDDEHYYEDSEIIRSEPRPYTAPVYYKVLQNCNVRELPSTSSERIGGLKAGTIIAVSEIRDGFLKFNYDGQDGWIMEKLCELTGAHYRKVVFIPNIDGTSDPMLTFQTNYDGKLDPYVFEQVTETWNKEIISKVITHFTDEKGNELDWTTVFEKDTLILAQWDNNPDAITLNLYRSDGKFIEKRDALAGTRFYDYLPWETGAGLLITAWKTMQGIEYTPQDLIPENVKNEWDLYAQIASDNRYRIQYDTALREKPADTASIITLLKTGERVEFMDRVVLGEDDRDDYLRVKTEDGTAGYVRKLDLNGWVKNFVVTMKGNGGWCGADQIISHDSIRYSELPTPTRDGHIFTGWKLTEGTMVSNRKIVEQFDILKAVKDARMTLLTDVTLEAQWVDASAKNARTGLLVCFNSRLIHSRDCTGLHSFYEAPGERKIRNLNYDNHYFALVDVIGDIEYGSNGKGYYRVLLPTGETGYIEAEVIHLDYSLVELKSGRYTAYTDLYGHFYDAKLTVRPFTTVIVPDFSGNPVRTLGDYDGDGVLESYYLDKSRFKNISCQVTFDANGGELIGERFLEVPPGTKLTTPQFPNAVLPNATLVGWYTEPVGGQLVAVDYPINEGMTLYAHYRYSQSAKNAPMFVTARSGGVPLYDKTMTKVIDTLPRGYIMQVTRTSADGSSFLLGEYLGRPCGIREDDVAVVERNVATISVTVRSAPNSKGKRQAVLPAGSVVFVYDYNDGWYEIVWPSSGDTTAYFKSKTTDVSRT